MEVQNTQIIKAQMTSLARACEIYEISYIYTYLIKLGYPKITKLTLSQITQIQSYVNCYFYSTPSREHLLEWLLAIIYPNYRETEQYKIQNDNIGRLVVSLWKIGVLPFSKHTKNLDYHKYVMAMLGYQNSVNLIYRMVVLALEIVYLKKSKMDTNFGSFLHQAIDNYTELINQSYDIYGITFPSIYAGLNAQQFHDKYLQFCKQKIEYIKQNQQQSTVKQKQFEEMFQNVSKNGSIFQQKYSQLIQKIKIINDKFGSLVKIQHKQPIQKRIQRRTLNITKQLCQKYKSMKKMAGSISPLSETDQNLFKNKKQYVKKLLEQLNQVQLDNMVIQ